MIKNTSICGSPAFHTEEVTVLNRGCSKGCISKLLLMVGLIRAATYRHHILTHLCSVYEPHS